jgi:quercetin 2,3-dioxygenase
MNSSPIISTKPLGFPWETADPFLFCVYHDDAYPQGNDHMGPDAVLAGRALGQDFAGKDGWRMYHGMTVPGFPSHPHRGFETVTIVRRGLIDHSDSLGATARFGAGDVQWLTAGKGIVHAEMFPLVDRSKPNPLELFQIWLNLPARSKMVEPYFKMLWSEHIPRQVITRADGSSTEIACIAGRIGDLAPPSPPPDSWAAQADTDLAIVTLKMSAGARWTLPAAATAQSNRRLYFFHGSRLLVDDRDVPVGTMIELRPDVQVELVNGDAVAEILMLQGKPIKEPVAQHGPFVMNTQAEVQQAFQDYRATQFGGWPWKRSDPVHAREQGRFARHADGKVETR